MNKKPTEWFVYILLCDDNTLYTGITKNIDRRIKEHNDDNKNSKGAKYTRSRQPVSLVYSENSENRSIASKREHEIKKLNRQQKQLLISSKILT
jgi:putative endonuclease